MRSILLLVIFLIVCLQAFPAQSSTYYISPTGSDANPGTSAKPWLTFSHALNSSRAWCGDTLVLLNGTYGDGTSTGKINVNGAVCTAGDELRISAQNQRKAKIVDSGSGVAIAVSKTAYLIVDGLVASSTDFSPGTNSDRGRPIEVRSSNHIIIRNAVVRNPNRYANAPLISMQDTQDSLVEDGEGYIFHRHCVGANHSERVIVRRMYCNPRGGRIETAPGGLGGADAVFSMYPCKDCILENSIGDGTTNAMFLNEMNATYTNNILMSGSKVLGSICYKCNYANGIYPNARKVADLNHTPQNITIRDVALIDFNSRSAAIRCSDCVNATIDHITVIGGGSGVSGLLADDTSLGSSPTTNSITITNMLVTGLTGTAFRVTGYNTWSGDKNRSHLNGTLYSPSHPSNWGDTRTGDPGLGTCKLWIPAGAWVKGAGTNGSDIGANILYRYVNGVLTNTPLWDPRTGEFPHGEDDLDETNNVAGQSLKDFHLRVNVNTGGCLFPRNYGNGASDTKSPVAPVGLRAS
jgi:hypothetical protein